MKKLLLFLSFFVFSFCSTSAQEVVEKPAIGFSPDGDGIDDTFDFHSVNMKTLEMKVVDASGNIVFESAELSSSWDGKDKKGQPVKEGTYIFMAKAFGLDDKEYSQSGKILLRRNK